MNIFRVVNTVLYPLFIFLLLFSGRNLVESADKSAGASPGSGAGTQVSTPSTDPGASPTSTPPAGTNESQPASATPPASPASGTDDNSKGSETTTPKTGVEVCIKNNKKATDQFDYKKEGNVVTYTAKGDYGFKLVKQKNTEIWKSDNEKGYATKVVLNGKGKKEKVVTIHMPDGTTKSYKRDGQNKPWNEYTGPLPSTDNAKATNESDGSGFELNIKSDDDKSEDGKYDVTTSISKSKIYTIKSNAKCNVVKCDNKEVWKYDSSKNFGHPKKINYNKEQNKIIITLDNGYLEYDKNGEQWELNKNASTKETSNTNSTSGTGGGTGTGTGTDPSGTDPSRGGTGTGTGGGTHTGGSAQGGGGGTHTGSGGGAPPANPGAGGQGGGTSPPARGGGTDQTSGGRH